MSEAFHRLLIYTMPRMAATINAAKAKAFLDLVYPSLQKTSSALHEFERLKQAYDRHKPEAEQPKHVVELISFMLTRMNQKITKEQDAHTFRNDVMLKIEAGELPFLEEAWIKWKEVTMDDQKVNRIIIKLLAQILITDASAEHMLFHIMEQLSSTSITRDEPFQFIDRVGDHPTS